MSVQELVNDKYALITALRQIEDELHWHSADRQSAHHTLLNIEEIVKGSIDRSAPRGDK